MSNIGDDLGEDFAGYNDADPNLTAIGGRLALLHAIARRFSTSSLWYDKTYGRDLRQYVGTSVPSNVIATQAQEQIEQDERVFSASVTVTRVRLAHGAEKLKLTMLITDDEGPFERTLLVSETTVEIFD
jgi:phosphatidate phosphatase APP1